VDSAKKVIHAKYRMILKATLKAHTGFEYRLAGSRTAVAFSLK